MLAVLSNRFEETRKKRGSNNLVLEGLRILQDNSGLAIILPLEPSKGLVV